MKQNNPVEICNPLIRAHWRVRYLWEKFWVGMSGLSPIGRAASWLALQTVAPLHGRYSLRIHKSRGYFSPSVKICHPKIVWGRHTFLGERVVIFGNEGAGPVAFGDDNLVGDDCTLETGQGGSIFFDDRAMCNFRCHFAAYKSPILIGKDVSIAQGCSFFSHDHGPSFESHKQLITKGPIIIEDGVWLGVGVTVLGGVRIGKGAVVAAGAVVTRDVASGAVAAGIPAKVIKMRSELTGKE